jgi:AcrR family transcriptional regulator
MNGADRKNSILEAAKPLFAQKGYNGTSVRDIARAAKVSEALLYKHFPSKEKLFNEILRFPANAHVLTLEEMAKLEPGAETLVKYVYVIMKLIMFEVPGMETDQFWHERLMFRSLLGDTAYAKRHFKNIQNHLEESITACIHQATQHGDMTNIAISPENRMWFIHHLAMGLNLCHLSTAPAFDYEGSKLDLVRQAVLFSLRGMGMADEAISKYYKPDKLERLCRKMLKA